MRGRIARYNEQKGYGFIRGEDGSDRFFHISNVKSLELPVHGAIVEFTSSQSEKGLTATDVHVQERTANKNHPVFAVFGDVRVKLSNIKNYGISQETQGQVYRSIQTTTKPERTTMDKVRETAAGLLALTAFVTDSNDLGYLAHECLPEEKKAITKIRGIKIKDGITRRYLYVTTFQKDNYTFYENTASFNIDEKCKELDELLS
ncbi:MAG: cold shock domain-containing protein [Defluviitaleaceae bacterium]|nr:cold shock domain-containing protein [Defluviitaleaceae bacterium]